jgi:DNA invertase Pin-like site-specific DNA recombinase
MRQAIIYTRFSPRANADKCESCEVQRDYCEKYAAAHGMEITAVFDDPDVSGADEYREKLWQAIEALQKGGVLVVYKRDRLARNVYLSEQINRAVEKKGATIEAVTGDVQGNSAETVMIRQVLAAIAEYERKMIAARTKHAMRFHMSQGRRMGSECPYGWEPDPADPKRMLPCRRELKVVEEIRAKHAEGMAYHAIMTWLNKERRDLARHGAWNAKTVRKICLAN